MEHTEEGFRHIPFRLYVPDLGSRPYIQFLIKPIENDRKNTLHDLISRARTKNDIKGKTLMVFFIQIDALHR